MIEILIVDNEEAVTTGIRRLLTESIGDKIILSIYNKWDEAVTRIEEGEPFDLIITDFRMPRGREGLAVIKAARQKSSGTKIILMSGDVTDTDRDEASPDEFYDKSPCNSVSLVDVIRKLFPKI